MNERSPSLSNIKPTKIRKTIMFFLILFNILGLLAGNIVYNKVIRAEIDRTVNNYEYYKSTFNHKRLEHLDIENVRIKSNFQYYLSGTYIKNPKQTKDTIVVVHGFRGSRWESMKYADMYIDLGYNVLIYDSRYHGKSEGEDITLGFMEEVDLDNCIKWINEKTPGGLIGVHGESLGGVTALLHSRKNEERKLVKFYVVDCPYSDLGDLANFLLKQNIRSYHPVIGHILSFYCNIVVFLRSGFTLYAISPINAIKYVETPIMFIHGADDQYVPPTMSIEMYRLKKGEKGIYIAPSSGHSQSYLFNRDEYTRKVKAFINQALEEENF